MGEIKTWPNHKSILMPALHTSYTSQGGAGGQNQLGGSGYGGSGSGRGRSIAPATLAGLSQGVYNKDFTGAEYGFERTATFNDPGIGLQAAVFERENQRVVAFAWTGPGSLENWIANLTQAFGFESNQYTEGLRIAQAEARKGGDWHLLGGGIAAASAIVTGGTPVTLNVFVDGCVRPQILWDF